jgi:hypothetical protein
VREVDQGWCQSSWRTKEWEWVMVISGERAGGVVSVVRSDEERRGAVVVIGDSK